MKRTLLLVFVLLCYVTLLAQENTSPEKFTVSGTIKSKAKGETIIGATVRAGNSSTASNEYGFYSLTLPRGTYTLEITAIGLQSLSQPLELTGDIRLNLFLEEEVKSLEGVIVSAQSRGRSISSPQMGMERISTREIKNVPVLLG